MKTSPKKTSPMGLANVPYKAAAMLLTLVLSVSVHAEIYKWTDENGRIHYSDAKPADDTGKPAPKVEQVELTPITIMDDGKVNNTSNETVALADQLMEKLEALAPDFNLSGQKSDKPTKANVEIYTTAWCGACKKAKSWLRSQGITYKEYDVEKSREAAMRMRKLGGGGGVPFAVINGDTVSGFSAQAYESALAR